MEVSSLSAIHQGFVGLCSHRKLYNTEWHTVSKLFLKSIIIERGCWHNTGFQIPISTNHIVAYRLHSVYKIKRFYFTTLHNFCPSSRTWKHFHRNAEVNTTTTRGRLLTMMWGDKYVWYLHLFDEFQHLFKFTARIMLVMPTNISVKFVAS